MDVYSPGYRFNRHPVVHIVKLATVRGIMFRGGNVPIVNRERLQSSYSLRLQVVSFGGKFLSSRIYFGSMQRLMCVTEVIS